MPIKSSPKQIKWGKMSKLRAEINKWQFKKNTKV